MTIKQCIDQDLKQAMLSGDKTLATTLRGIKSVILYAEVAANKRDQGLDDQEVIPLLQKEAKKRQESVDLYRQGGNQERAEAELAEKGVIEAYLPAQLSDEDLDAIVDEVVKALDEPLTPTMMGQAIGAVKQKTEGQADGGRIAAAVKARLKA